MTIAIILRPGEGFREIEGPPRATIEERGESARVIGGSWRAVEEPWREEEEGAKRWKREEEWEIAVNPLLAWKLSNRRPFRALPFLSIPSRYQPIPFIPRHLEYGGRDGWKNTTGIRLKSLGLQLSSFQRETKLFVRFRTLPEGNLIRRSIAWWRRGCVYKVRASCMWTRVEKWHEGCFSLSLSLSLSLHAWKWLRENTWDRKINFT